MITKNQITAYCLLAHVNDNERGIHDLAQIFIPLVKKTIASFMATGVRAGKANDIKKEFDLLFGLDIPFGLVQRFMRQIEQDLNKPGMPPTIRVHDDGSFILSDFEFTELDELLRQQNADIELIEDSYTEFIKSAGLKKEEEPSVFEFLDSHHQELSGFFSSRSNFETHIEYTTPALFIDNIKNNDNLFGILRRIYLGSLISSYLQIPPNTPGGNIKELVLDTSFIISLLDLSSEESYHTCQMVLQLAKNLGWKITVLNITLDETKALIERCSEYIDTNSLPQFLAPTSIEAGCARRKLSKTDLLRIASSLQKLLTEHKVTYHNVTTRMVSKARDTDLYKKITGRSRNPDGAHHDGLAAYYVASKRGGSTRSLLDTDCWFVSSHDPHRDNGLRLKNDGSFFETIRAEYLLNVMWLSSPSARILEVPTLGLSKLVASTIERSLPSHVVLREFDHNLQKLGPDELTADDVALVANSTAVKSAIRLEHLNTLAKTNREQFCHDVLSIADEERERIRKLEESVDKERQLRGQIEIRHRKAEDQIRKTEDQLNKAHTELYRIKLTEIEAIKETIISNEMAFEIATRRSKILKQVLRWSGVIVVLLIAYLSWLIVKLFGWQTIEPVFSILNIILPLFLISVCYAMWGENLKTILKRIEDAAHSWVLQRSGVSEDKIEELRNKLATLQNQLSLLPQEQES